MESLFSLKIWIIVSWKYNIIIKLDYKYLIFYYLIIMTKA